MFSEEFLIITFERNRGSFVPRAPLGKANQKPDLFAVREHYAYAISTSCTGIPPGHFRGQERFFSPFLNHSLAAWREQQ